MTREDIHARLVDTSVESLVDNFEGGSSLYSLGLSSLKVIKDREEVVIEEGADHAEKEERTSLARVKRQ
jgi:ATP phosphoribosyltransferase